MELERIKMYNVAMDIGEEVWELVNEMDDFSKRTTGNQIVKSSDSIAANISEGEGMFHFGDKKRFLYYARGSSFESKTWLAKMKRRGQVGLEKYEMLIGNIEEVIKMINGTLYRIPKK